MSKLWRVLGWIGEMLAELYSTLQGRRRPARARPGPAALLGRLWALYRKNFM